MSALLSTTLAVLLLGQAGVPNGAPPTPSPEPAAESAPEPVAVDAEAPPSEPPVTSVGESTAPSQGFVKGELTMYLGADRLVVKHNRIGVSAGLDQFGNAFYLLAEPMIDLRFLDDKLGFGIGAPLRFELVNFDNGPNGQPLLTSRLGRLRTEDWASIHDFGRALKYITYGRKEDRLFISAGQRYASTVGHGALVRRYAPNLDILYPRASAQLDYYNEYIGFELLTNDVLEWNQLAGLAFVKPLAILGATSTWAKSLSIGVSGAVDWKAPFSLTVDAATGVRQLDSDGRLQVTQRAARLFGIDAEVKVVKTQNVDIKPYVDYSMLVDGDGGLTVGALGRFNVGSSTVHAFRLVAEFRSLGSRYQPSYFDTFYEVDRFVFRELPRLDPGVARYGTKLESLLGDGLGQRLGYYTEASWGIPGSVGVTLALEGVSNAPEKNLVAHLEVPALSFLQFFGSFYKRGVVQFSEVTTLDEKTVLFAGARLQILPILFVNARAYKTFRMNPALQRYDNQFGFAVDVEVGYEFGGKRNLPPPPAPDDAPSPSDGSAVEERPEA